MAALESARQFLVRLLGYDPTCPASLKSTSAARDSLSTVVEQLQDRLDIASKDTDGKNKLIADLTAQANLLQSQMTQVKQELLNLQLQRAAAPTDTFAKPKPAMLQEVEPQKVMLGDFVVRTARGEFVKSYPQHSAVFMPCAFYEQVLTRAGCNSRRTDLTEPQICKAIANAIQPNMTYTTDDLQWGRLDNWTLPVVAWSLRNDDCESESMNIISAIHYYETKFGAFKDYSVLLGLGNLIQGSTRYGHAFVVVMHHTSLELKDSFIIEATSSTPTGLMALQDAKASYIIDWGLIGGVRMGHEAGTYLMDPKYLWWGPGGAVGSTFKQEKSLTYRILRLLNLTPSKGKLKEAYLKEIWANNKTV